MPRNSMILILLVGVVLVAAAGLFVNAQRGAALTAENLALVARTIARGEDQVRVPDLARQIIEDRAGLVLVDIRSLADFEAGHIPGALHIPMPEVVGPEATKHFPRKGKLVLYGNGTTDAGQAAALLRVAGVEAFSLLGGYNHWQRFTADPSYASEADDDVMTSFERQAIACYFHGDYLAGSGIPVQTSAAAFTPAVTPVGAGPTAAPAPAADSLGLGLGLGLGPTPAQPAAPAADSLGLGLGLGLGPQGAAPAPAATPAPGLGLPAAVPGPPAGLIIGEGC